jgi:hypothetical protein
VVRALSSVLPTLFFFFLSFAANKPGPFLFPSFFLFCSASLVGMAQFLSSNWVSSTMEGATEIRSGHQFDVRALQQYLEKNLMGFSGPLTVKQVRTTSKAFSLSHTDIRSSRQDKAIRRFCFKLPASVMSFERNLLDLFFRLRMPLIASFASLVRCTKQDFQSHNPISTATILPSLEPNSTS